MVEGAGLGVFPPEAIGPSNIQSRNGVIDVLVEDEAEAVSIAKKYLSYFQGRLPEWKCEDQRKLRHIVPENRVHAYSMREVIRIMADTDSVLELRASYAPAMITALVRVEGQSIGVIANNPAHLGGALDAEASNKMARFIELCDAYDLPIVALCDTPGFMVGPDAESSALVRHVGRMFVGAANLTTAYIAIFLRKGYGLAAQAMAAGSFHAPFFTAAWPTGEFGAMNLEGAVRLSDGKALDAISDENAREAEIQARVKSSYDRGKAISVAESFEIDDVIDPATTRNWICQVLRSLPPVEAKKLKKRAHIELW